MLLARPPQKPCTPGPSLPASPSHQPSRERLLSGKFYPHWAPRMLLHAGALHMVMPSSLGQLREGVPIIFNCRARDGSKDIQNTCSSYRAMDSHAHFLPNFSGLEPSDDATPQLRGFCSLLITNGVGFTCPAGSVGPLVIGLHFHLTHTLYSIHPRPPPPPAFPNMGHTPFPLSFLPEGFSAPLGVSSPSLKLLRCHIYPFGPSFPPFY